MLNSLRVSKHFGVLLLKFKVGNQMDSSWAHKYLDSGAIYYVESYIVLQCILNNQYMTDFASIQGVFTKN